MSFLRATTQPPAAPERRPRIAVLMASFNGVRWIADQVASVLDQTGVEVALFVSDDGSTDGTVDWLADLCAKDPRVRWARNANPQGSAAPNFFHMICALDVEGFDHVAFADQDDVWVPGKLALQVAQLASHGADGVSSDVIAFWPSGKTHYLRKSTPQRRCDFMFESPGPGCSMLITPRLLARLQELLRDAGSPARTVGYHDWLIYAVCRASGWRWYIGDQPTLRYRQHDANEIGINKGVAAWWRRAERYRGGRFADDCRAVLSVAAACARRDGRMQADLSVIDILREGRRRRLHRIAMALLFPRGLRQPVSAS